MKSQTDTALIAGRKPLMASHTINVRIRLRTAKLAAARHAISRVNRPTPTAQEGRMYDDLKRRLADGFPTKQGFSGYYPDVAAVYAERTEALAAITALEAEVARMRGLLSDLADAFEREAGRGGDFPEQYAWPEYRAARAALVQQPAGDVGHGGE